LGWTEGRNVQFDFRSGLADADRYRRYAAELVALAPDVILATGASTAGPLLQVTHSLPIVFVQTTDPRGNKIVRRKLRGGVAINGKSLFISIF
jgi:putative ABC transport system substrate-binding protein